MINRFDINDYAVNTIFYLIKSVRFRIKKKAITFAESNYFSVLISRNLLLKAIIY